MEIIKGTTDLRFSIEDDPDTGEQFALFIPPNTKNWSECENNFDALLESPTRDHQYIIDMAELLDIEPAFLDIYAHIGSEYFNNNFTKEGCKWYADGVKIANPLIPKNFKGKIEWCHLENRPFLRLHHGHILCAIDNKQYKKAEKLIETHLKWNPDDNLGLRYLLGEICILNGKLQKAKKHLTRTDVIDSASTYSLALIEFSKGRYVQAATALRLGFSENQYVAEILTGRSNPSKHFFWHGSNLKEPEQAIWYTNTFGLEIWKGIEGAVDFCDWLFNCAAVLKERSELASANEGLTYEKDFEKRGEFVDKKIELTRSIDNTISKQIIRKFTDRSGNEIWPWEHEKLAHF